MKLSKKINALNDLVYKPNKFTFYEHDFGDWFPVYVDLENYKKSEIIYSTYFGNVYCELLYDWCTALNLSYLFTLTPIEYDSCNDVFLSEKTKKIKNKNSNIRLSAYLQHIVKTFEDTELDVFSPRSVHAIFDYDDISVIETVRSVLLEFLVKSSAVGISEGLKIFEKNTKHTLKLLKKRNKISKQDKIDVQFEKIENSEIDNDLLTINETMIFLKKSRGTIENWSKQGKIIKHYIEGSVYFKKSELREALIKSK